MQLLPEPGHGTTVSPWQVALAFALSGAVAIASIFGPDQLPRSLGLPGFSSSGKIIAMLAGSFIGGSIGGLSLRRGWRPVAGFGCGFTLLAPLLLLSLFALQGIGRTSLPGLFLFFAFYWGIGFAVAGAVGTASMGKGAKFVLLGTGAFALGAAAGGALIALMVELTLLSNSPFSLLIGVFLGPLLAFGAAGFLFAKTLRYWEASQASAAQ
jgi:hypothetical protein